MQIAVLGTGVVGQTLAARLAGLGHQVAIGTRDPAATLARSEPDRFGNPPLRDYLAAHPDLTLATFTDAAAGAELLVNATNGEASQDVLGAAGADNLAGKVILDISNALDFADGFPPHVGVGLADSVAERLQRAFPAARVVKALNTMNAYLMVDPAQLAGGDHTVLVAGNDDDAKKTVTELLASFGWRDILDLGALSAARGAELYVALWVQLLPVVGGGGQFNIKVVR